MRTLMFLSLWSVVTGCAASLGMPGLDLGDGEALDREAVAAKATWGEAPYKIGNKTYKAEWIACERTATAAVVVLINPDNQSFNQGSCGDWAAQSFLYSGYSVIAINRPGFGKTTPKQDFSGPFSVAAIKAAIQQADKKLTWFKGQVTGFWATQGAVISASFWAKSSPDIHWAILGNGIYDLEEFRGKTKSKSYAALIKDAHGSQDADAFNEARSIAWDTTGLPKKIMMYHGAKNQVVPSEQARSFRDTLAAEEFGVKLEELPELGHELNQNQHRLVLEALLKRLHPASS